MQGGRMGAREEIEFWGDGGAEGFGPCPLANWCASSSQCKGLELLLDGIFSHVAAAAPAAAAGPASIWRDSACRGKRDRKSVV